MLVPSICFVLPCLIQMQTPGRDRSDFTHLVFVEPSEVSAPYFYDNYLILRLVTGEQMVFSARTSFTHHSFQTPSACSLQICQIWRVCRETTQHPAPTPGRFGAAQFIRLRLHLALVLSALPCPAAKHPFPPQHTQISLAVPIAPS